MMVSDKMIQKFTNLLWGYLGKTTNEKNRVEITQQIVNAAWTEFDPDDEKTWPKKNHKYYYLEVHLPDGRVVFELSKWQSFDRKVWYFNSANSDFIVRYADPQDLMFNKEV